MALLHLRWSFVFRFFFSFFPVTQPVVYMLFPFIFFTVTGVSHIRNIAQTLVLPFFRGFIFSPSLSSSIAMLVGLGSCELVELFAVPCTSRFVIYVME